MKPIDVIIVMLTFGLALWFFNKGEKSNIGADGKEIEPLTFDDKLLRGLDLTMTSIKEEIQRTRPKPNPVTIDEPEYVGEMPDNSKMMHYTSVDGTSAFTSEVKRTRGLFNHVN